MAIEVGRPAPAFTLPDQTGTPVSLESLRGQDVILYFYPKDDTPGCTREACGFRDLSGDLEQAGAVVLGVSPDQAPSHERFRGKYGLPFRLLSDPEKSTLTAYGAYGAKTAYGKTTVGVIRSTVWIGPDGAVKQHWARVADAGAHPAEVLAAVRQYRLNS
jgi:peroxiredoxin Q/BCP